MGGEIFKIDVGLRTELQIWRKFSPVTYNKINFSFLVPNETSHSDVHVNILPNPLKFQVGDIFGVYQPSDEKMRVFYQEDTGPVNYRDVVSRNNSASTLTVNKPDSRYYYPLVSVEILPGDVNLINLTTITESEILDTSTAVMTTAAAAHHSPIGTMDITTANSIIIIARVSSVVVALLVIIIVLLFTVIAALVLKKRNQTNYSSTTEVKSGDRPDQVVMKLQENTRHLTNNFVNM